MPKALWLLILGMVLNVTGSSFLWPLNTIYMHNHLGHSLTFAGFVLMLNSGAGVIGNLNGGTLFDKIGGYRSILAGIGVTASASIFLTFFHSTFFYIVFLVIIGFGSGIIFPSMYAMAGSVWREGGRKAFNALYVAQNLGVALGASIGGLIASFSFNYIFAANAFLYILFIITAWLGYRKIDDQRKALQMQTHIIEEASHIKDKIAFRALIILCIGFFISWVAYVQWQSAISSYTQSLGIPLGKYSLLWSVNGFLIVLGQPLVSWMNKKVPSIKVQILMGIILFILSFIVVSTSHVFWEFLTAMIVLTLGEMLVWPAVPSVAQDLAPEGRAGFYQGFVNSVATGGRMIGPLLGGVVVDLFSIHWLFIFLIVSYAGAIFTTLIYDKAMNRQILKFSKKCLTHE